MKILLIDPWLRRKKKIENDPNDQDEIKRPYMQKGPYQSLSQNIYIYIYIYQSVAIHCWYALWWGVFRTKDIGSLAKKLVETMKSIVYFCLHIK